MSSPDRNTFEKIYAGQPPGEFGRPQKALLDWPTATRAAVDTSHTEGRFGTTDTGESVIPSV
jgi:hypothetical protein